MPNFATSLGVGRDRDEMFGNGSGMFQSLESPVASRVRVGHRLEGRKGLRRDDEQCFLGVEVARGLGEVGAVDVGDEAESQVALAVMPQCLVRHHRPQVGPTDADIDDVANRLAGVALPFAAAHPVGEVSHLVEHGMDLRHDVFAIHDDGLPFGGAQGHVQDGPLFRDVDFVPAKHGIDAGPQAGFLRQLQQELERLIGDAVLRIVEVDADGLDRHPLPALGVVREELPEMQLADLRVMGFEGLPRRACGELCDCCHADSPLVCDSLIPARTMARNWSACRLAPPMRARQRRGS